METLNDNQQSFYEKSYSPDENPQIYLPDAPNGRNYDSNVLKIKKLKTNSLSSKKRLNYRNIEFRTEEIQNVKKSNDQVVMNSIMKRKKSYNKSPE